MTEGARIGEAWADILAIVVEAIPYNELEGVEQLLRDRSYEYVAAGSAEVAHHVIAHAADLIADNRKLRSPDLGSFNPKGA